MNLSYRQNATIVQAGMTRFYHWNITWQNSFIYQGIMIKMMWLILKIYILCIFLINHLKASLISYSICICLSLQYNILCMRSSQMYLIMQSILFRLSGFSSLLSFDVFPVVFFQSSNTHSKGHVMPQRFIGMRIPSSDEEMYSSGKRKHIDVNKWLMFFYVCSGLSLKGSKLPVRELTSPQATYYKSCMQFAYI